MDQHRFCRLMQRVIGLAFAAAVAACGSHIYVFSSDLDNDYMRAEHPFTDAAAAELKQRAERACAARKMAAVKTESACTLSKCVTTYQCTEKPELIR